MMNRVLTPEGTALTIATDPANGGGTFTIVASVGGVHYVSEPLGWDASLSEMRRATRHLPITISSPGTWWSKVIGHILTAVIVYRMARKR